ncbi:NUDIX hydrolase [Ornithinibacillus sp. 179-J 7C1 HS]|uniref:NUDIX hydrolase n=1 Tax=Ornithinibacillus sp. 179-J 7C1 HS TaxID=3142384 RepID=UPI00399F2F7F
MKEWSGAAAICINEAREVLMVRGKGTKAWAVPSGEMEVGETPEECCVREVREETGYNIKIKKALYIKETEIQGIAVTTHYFLVDKIGESSGIDDPDQLIAEMSWVSLEELNVIEHAYPEDKKTIIEVIQSQVL